MTDPLSTPAFPLIKKTLKLRSFFNYPVDKTELATLALVSSLSFLFLNVHDYVLGSY